MSSWIVIMEDEKFPGVSIDNVNGFSDNSFQLSLCDLHLIVFLLTGKDMFFHSSSVEGVHYEDLQEGQRVSYNVGQGPKGPRAENVRTI
mgnify:CR=1 FL=1